MGTVALIQGPQGVLLTVDLTGLTPGAHGFHIHETGRCSPDFAAAGDHFSLEGVEHGYMNPNGQHLGDMPNIYAAADETARADVFNNARTLAEGTDTSVFDADGSTIIVHEKEDTYGADAGAGGRVACGVIVRN
jgi:Cu-Zn family superoxide dismutase